MPLYDYVAHITSKDGAMFEISGTRHANNYTIMHGFLVQRAKDLLGRLTKHSITAVTGGNKREPVKEKQILSSAPTAVEEVIPKYEGYFATPFTDIEEFDAHIPTFIPVSDLSKVTLDGSDNSSNNNL